MALLVVNYYDVFTISKQNIKTELQSHLNIITATILQCKELSNLMPLQTNGSLADNTALNTLICDTIPQYKLDGEKNSFIPKPLTGFTTYTASQNANEFYFTTTTLVNSNNYKALQELQDRYSSNQYELRDDGTTVILNFYLSR